MKTQLTLAALALSLMTTSVFAASSSAPFPLVGEAITAFLDQLSDYEAPYDAYLRGDEEALSAQARRGEALFFSDAVGCSACHGGADFDQEGEERHAWFNTGLYDLGDGAYPPGRQGLFELTGIVTDIGRYRGRELRLAGPHLFPGLPQHRQPCSHHRCYNRGASE